MSNLKKVYRSYRGCAYQKAFCWFCHIVFIAVVLFPSLTFSDISPTNLVFWLRADMGITTNASGEVVEWADQVSGSSEVATNDGTHPLWIDGALNGTPVVRFGGDDRLWNDRSSSGNPIEGTQSTTFVVARRSAACPKASTVSCFPEGASRDWTNTEGFVLAYEGVSNDQMQTYRSGSLSTAPNPGVDKLYIYTTVFDGMSNTVYLNRHPSFPVLSTGSFSIDHVVIGQRLDLVFTNGFIGDIAEIGMYDKALSQAALKQLWRELESRYVGAAGAIDFNTLGSEIECDEANNLTGLRLSGPSGEWSSLYVGNDTNQPIYTNELEVKTSELIFSFNPTGLDSFRTYFTEGSSPLRDSAIYLDADTSTSVLWQITDLVPGAYYDLTLYGQEAGGSPSNPASFSIEGYDAGNGIGAPVRPDAEFDGNFTEVLSDTNGSIFGHFSRPSGQTFASWSGLQIERIPDPPATACVYHVALTGDDEQAGDAANPLRTIQAAAQKAWAGDRIVVHEGEYRERITPRRGGESDSNRIIYEAAQGETVIIKGSEVVSNWTHIANDTWSTSLENSYFGSFNPYNDVVGGEWYLVSGYPKHTGAVYQNGDWLTEAPNQSSVLQPVGSNVYWYAKVGSTSTTIWAQFPGGNPTGVLTEINVRRSVFYPDMPGIDYITVRGFDMRHAATPWAGAMSEQVGLLGTHWSKGWIIENNEISYSLCTGVTLGRYGDWREMPDATADGYKISIDRAIEDGWTENSIGGHIVRNNKISHCEKAGIHGSLGGIFSVIQSNTISEIANLQWLSGFDRAGIKLLASFDTTISGNRVYDSWMGIWLDWMAQGTRVSHNLCYENTSFDLYMEVNHGPYLVDNNLFMSDVSLRSVSRGGAYVHNLMAGDIQVKHDETRTTPYMLPHSTTFVTNSPNPSGDERFYNNLFVGGTGLSPYDVATLSVYMGGNVFLEGSSASSHEDTPLVLSNYQASLQLDDQTNNVYLTFNFDPNWRDDAGCELVTTDLLGTTVVTKVSFLNPDDSSVTINSDYFREARNVSNPFPGPFEYVTGVTQCFNITSLQMVQTTYESYTNTITWSGSDSSPTADADDDGFVNLLEYAFGTDPMDSNDAVDISASLVDGEFEKKCEVLYYRNLEASDLSFSVEYVTNLVSANWISLGLSENDVTRVPIDGTMLQSVYCECSMPDEMGYYRIAVTKYNP